MRRLVVGAAVLLVLVGCGDESSSTASDGAGGSVGSGGSGGSSSTGGSTTTSTSSGGGGPFALTSPAYDDGEPIPQAHWCSQHGDGLSPQLDWGAGPEGTLSYAIILRSVPFDPDFFMWFVWDIPADARSLPGGLPEGFEIADPMGARQVARPVECMHCYFGPCFANENTYELTLYALNRDTLDELAMADFSSGGWNIEAAIEEAAIATTTLSGTVDL